jgi:phospholipid N-methyltransferase
VNNFKHHAQFLWQFARRPNTIGAVAPSSPHLARMMCARVRLGEADVVAELGGGTGAFTRHIITHAGRHTRILVFEINPRLAEMLRRACPRAEVINDSAVRLGDHLRRREIERVDHVVCGLPWAVFDDRKQHDVLRAIAMHLAPGGSFATFAYLHAAWFSNARKFRRRLQRHFAAVEASPIVWRNLPPAFVWRCTR